MSAAPPGVRVWYPLLLDVARAERVPWDLLAAVVWQESAGGPRSYRYEPAFWARYLAGKPEWTRGLSGEALAAWSSRAAASYGLMQIMYPTACLYGLPMHCEPEVLFEPRRNLTLGAHILRAMLERCGGNVEKALLRWNGGGRPAYAQEVVRKREAVKPASQGG